VANLFDIPGFFRSRDKLIEDCSFVSDVNTSIVSFECVLQLERYEGGGLLEFDRSVSDRTVFIFPPDATDLPPRAKYETSNLEKFDHSMFKEFPMLGGKERTSSKLTFAASQYILTSTWISL